MRMVDARYFLRVWQDGRRGDGLRASLRDLTSGATQHFADLEELSRHLSDLDHPAADEGTVEDLEA